MSKIGVDIDGVLATFWKDYEELHIRVAGKDLFGPNRYPAVLPQCWNWPNVTFGYSYDVTDEVWRLIGKDPNFWKNLWPLPQATEALEALGQLELAGHEVTFITSRPGIAARLQTQNWLLRHGMELPTVIVASDKASFVRLMNLDAYIDDRLLNCNDVMREIRDTKALTRMYLVEQPYNKRPLMDLEAPPPITEWDEWRDPALIPVSGVLEALRKEELL